MPLTASIEVPAGQSDATAFVVKLRIKNNTDHVVRFLNPDMGRPSAEMKWPWSNETYQTSLLISFHYLSISVTDEKGQVLPQQAIQTWATPVLRQKLELEPGAAVELMIPVGNFYQLKSGQAYWLTVECGDNEQKVTAREHVLVK